MRLSRGFTIVALALFAVACGGGGEPAAEDTATGATEQETTSTDTETEAAGGPSGEPILIGAAIDTTEDMAPFNNPANAAAQIMVDRVNAEGGVNGRSLELVTQDTTLDPEQTRSVAQDLIEQGAAMLFVTCDFDFAAPAAQEAVAAGVLAVAPCIGTDRMGPKGLGEQGDIAFSFGNVAQDEGAVLAEFALDQDWQNAVVVKDNSIIYFQDAVDSFAARYQEEGGTVVSTESFTQGDGTINNVVSNVANAEKDVIAISTAFADLPAFVSGLRSLGDDTPIICSWSCDGSYWVPDTGAAPFYYNTFVSVFDDDPNQDVNEFVQAMEEQTDQPPATGGFIGGAQAVTAFADAVEETGGTDAEAIADYFEGFDDYETLFGPISFSEEFHTVFGREHRIMSFEDGTPQVFEARTANSPADIG